MFQRCSPLDAKIADVASLASRRGASQLAMEMCLTPMANEMPGPQVCHFDKGTDILMLLFLDSGKAS
jgi:hypothetical protein